MVNLWNNVPLQSIFPEILNNILERIFCRASINACFQPSQKSYVIISFAQTKPSRQWVISLLSQKWEKRSHLPFLLFYCFTAFFIFIINLLRIFLSKFNLIWMFSFIIHFHYYHRHYLRKVIASCVYLELHIWFYLIAFKGNLLYDF